MLISIRLYHEFGLVGVYLYGGCLCEYISLPWLHS